MNLNVLEETSRGLIQVSIESKMMKERKLFLTSSIDSNSSVELIQQLMYLENEGEDEIVLYINSPGGQVDSGLAVYDYMMHMKAPITTICIGTAASMASILFMAGTRRLMYEHTKVMIHDPSYASFDVGGLKPHEIKEKIESLEETSKLQCQLIQKHTKLSEEQIQTITKKDTYFTAKEALKAGICTEIIR